MASALPGCGGSGPQGLYAATKDLKQPDERQIKYVVAPEGLRVEVAGVRFMVSAETKQIGQGWGIRLNVKADSIDDKDHVLLSPKSGPLALSADVYRRVVDPPGKSAPERSSDSREGETTLSIPAGSPITFSRDFPGAGRPALAIGDTLEMQVALWGLGGSDDERRPVKQFVHVRMAVGKDKPSATVEPPPK